MTAFPGSELTLRGKNEATNTPEGVSGGLWSQKKTIF